MYFPACFVEIPDLAAASEPQSAFRRRAPFYLAAEEWIASHLPASSYLFTWQLGRTVVMGRNQVAHQEVNLDFCREHHIDVIRRKSGGGAIFADEGNIMISFVTTQGSVEPIFMEYATAVSRSLNELGAHTEVHGRNDVILMGKGKVCGNAFYHFADRNIVHGTMLYDTDPELMQGALHSDLEKLQGKGVKSIRARVGVLKGDLNAPQGLTEAEEIAWLRSQLRQKLTDRSIVLDASAVSEIEQIERGYYTDEFLLGSSAHDEEVLQARIEGCGTIEIHFSLKGSLVRKVHLTGDFFELSDAQKAFAEAFEGVAFTRESFCEAITKHHPERSVRNLSQEQLIGLWNY